MSKTSSFVRAPLFGWSYPLGCSGPPDPTEQPCEVCGLIVDDCICPECPVCGDNGNPECYEKHGLVRSPEQIEGKKKYDEELARFIESELARVPEDSMKKAIEELRREWRELMADTNPVLREENKMTEAMAKQYKEETMKKRHGVHRQIAYTPEEEAVLLEFVKNAPGGTPDYKKLRTELSKVREDGALRRVETLHPKVSIIRKKLGITSNYRIGTRGKKKETPKTSLSDKMLDMAAEVGRLEGKIVFLEAEIDRYKSFFDAMKPIREAVEDFQKKHLEDKI